MIILQIVNNFGISFKLKAQLNSGVRVERLITSPLPHRSVRADFPHTVPLKLVSLKDKNDKSWVLTMGTSDSPVW